MKDARYECTELFFKASDAMAQLRIAQDRYDRALTDLIRAKGNYERALAARRAEMEAAASSAA